ncbi:MAG: competence/damage-inducible protein A [bacterium]|nr:competence/damage-inducible protein A [bacterium]
MVVELISVGTEILLGNIVNTNAAFLAEQCAYLGLSCFYQTTVGDNEERLAETLHTALKRSDVIILSGGLGPTRDDLTKEVAAKVLGKSMYMDEKQKESIKTFFEKRGLPLTDNNWKQALIPEGAIILYNDNGTAPGIIMEEGEKTVILLPGPPNELLPMFKKDVYDYLNRKTPNTISSQVVKICGMGESQVEDMVKDLMENDNPTLAPYAKTGEVHLRVTAMAENDKEAKKLTKPVVKELKSRIGSYIYTTNPDVTLEEAVVDLLDKNHLTFCTAESCTGGMLAARLVNVPGVSEVFKEGMITYSNKAKRNRLGVKKGTLAKYGAVSEQVAKEMAKGGCFFTKSDVCVAVTGIAGPDGGTEEKPVGLVYIACNVCGKVTVKEYHFSGNRAKIRENTVSSALTLMRLCVLEYFSEITFGKKEK